MPNFSKPDILSVTETWFTTSSRLALTVFTPSSRLALIILIRIS